VYSDSLGRKVGIENGDRIVAVGGKPVERVGTVGSRIVLEEARSVTIERNGRTFDLPLPEDFVKKLNDNKLGGFTYIRYPLIVDSVLKGAKLVSGSVQKGDVLTAFNGQPVQFNTDMFPFRNYKDKNAELAFLRNGRDTVKATVFFDSKAQNGIAFKSPDQVLGTRHLTYSLAKSIPRGIERCWETLSMYMTGIKQLFTGKANPNESVGSVISIGNVFPGDWHWPSFWALTGIFSIILAFMNVLPIPGLDGGHALFTIYEMITGHKPSDKFMEYAQMVGMVLLLGLMLYAFGLDLWRLFK